MTDYVVTTLDDENDAGETEAGVLGAGLSLREAIERAKSARDRTGNLMGNIRSVENA